MKKGSLTWCRNTIVAPKTMVVHHKNAAIARATMVRAWSLHTITLRALRVALLFRCLWFQANWTVLWWVACGLSGTTPFWCKGGSRYVEGCWRFPYVKIKNRKFPFHVFERHEIHIQYFEDLLRGSSSFTGVRLRLLNFSKFSNFRIRITDKSEFQTNQNFRISSMQK